jgi:hypothetical protein
MDRSSVRPAGLGGIEVDAGRSSLVSARALFYSEVISNALRRLNCHSPAIHAGTNSGAYIAGHSLIWAEEPFPSLSYM